MDPVLSYSGQAMQAYYAGQIIEAVGFRSIGEVLDAQAAGTIGRAVVPVENLLGDVVYDSISWLMEFGGRKPPLTISGELMLPIEHVLAAKCPLALEAVKQVSSHSQAIRQCKKFLAPLAAICEALPNGASTAKAAEIVAQSEPAACLAAITSRAAAEAYGLSVIAENIGDKRNNMTRFVVLGGPEPMPSGDDKTTMFLTTADQAGALCDVLAVFKVLGINLNKIDSHTAQTEMGECIFWIDAAGHRKDDAMKVALTQMERYTQEIRLIGSYPRAAMPTRKGS